MQPFPSLTQDSNLAGIKEGALITYPSLLRLSWFWPSTRRHANRDTRLKPTEDFTAHRILNLLIQLDSSTPHPAVSTSSGLPHSLPQNHQRLAALHPAHLPHTHPPLTQRADDHIMDPTQHSTSNHLDHRVPLHCATTLSIFIIASFPLEGSTVVEHVI